MKHLKFILVASFLTFCPCGPNIQADIISEYMFNMLAMGGSITSCKEVTKDPIGAKKTVVGLIDSINSISPNNKIDGAYALEKFDAVLVYCIANPNELLLNALLKTSAIGNNTNTPPPANSMDNNMPKLNQPSEPTNNNSPVQSYKLNKNAPNKVEFIN